MSSPLLFVYLNEINCIDVHAITIKRIKRINCIDVHAITIKRIKGIINNKLSYIFIITLMQKH
jgi:hypothetical protein